jgi:hypothetical protein
MTGLSKHFDFTSSTAAEGLGLSIRNRRSPKQAVNGLDTLANFPKRPDISVLSETIPLYYIGQYDSLELDVTNEGSRIVEPLTEIIDFVRRRAPKFTAFVSMLLTKWRKLDALILLFCSSESTDRTPDVIRGGYTVLSKNGDDTLIHHRIPSAHVQRPD